MPQLELTLLGGFQARLDGQLLRTFRSSNTQGLLVYLVLQGERPLTRDLLAGLLWPDEPNAKAKKNLRQTVYQLRQLLRDSDDSTPFLLTSRQTIQFNPQKECRCDVRQFEAAVRRGAWETAVTLYKGELLAGLTFDSADFETWLRQERERLHHLILTTLDDLAARQLHSGDFEAAQASARRLLTLEPWRESAHQLLMRALMLAGDRSGALAQFEQCQQILEQELGISPTQETFDLVRRIEAEGVTQIDPDLVAGQYRMGHVLGEGGMGLVCKGVHKETKETVAIKVLDQQRITRQPELVARFLREADALRQLNHPNIVSYIDQDVGDGRYALVMEYVDGGDLRQLLSQTPQLPFDTLIPLALDLVDALTRSHRLGILHRDIKPSNVLLGSDGIPKLTDFGLARLNSDSNLTQTGTLMGTIAYMSPEACMGKKLDERADIWSFGILLYEMVTGHSPFAKALPTATLMAILNKPLPDILDQRPDVPLPLCHLLESMLIREREERLASVRQVGVALEQLSRELGGRPSPPVSTPAATTAPLPGLTTTQTAIPPMQAPQLPPHYIPKENEMAIVVGQLTRGEETAVALVGMGGIGKTTFATAVAHQVQSHFTDGVLWANVHNSSSNAILELWARAFGYEFGSLEDTDGLVTAVRSILADKAVLLVLDNVEDSALARPLMVQGVAGALLITTRNLDVASALNATPFPMHQLSGDQSHALLSAILGEARLAATPEETAAARQIGELVQHLPLAVEIVAQRLKSRPRMRLADMVTRLQSAQRRLGLEISDRAVRASFQVSWDGLDGSLRRVFAHMGLFAGRPFTVEALSKVMDRDFFDSEDDVYTLCALSLVNESGQTRYRQHPLLADFADEKLGDGRETAVGNYITYYLTYAQDFHNQYGMLKPEWENLNAAILFASRYDKYEALLDLVDCLSDTWIRYSRFHDANVAYGLAETAAQAQQAQQRLFTIWLNWADILLDQANYEEAGRLMNNLSQNLPHLSQEQQGKLHYLTGLSAYNQSDFGKAEEALNQSSQLLEAAPQRGRGMELLARVKLEVEPNSEEAEALLNQAIEIYQETDNQLHLSSAYRLFTMLRFHEGQLQEAEDYALKALEIGRMQHDRFETGTSLYLLLGINRAQGQYQQAIAYGEEAVAIFERMGDRRSLAMVYRLLSDCHLKLDAVSKAKEYAKEALHICRVIEYQLETGFVLVTLGDIYAQDGEAQQSVSAWQEAQKIGNALNHSRLLSLVNERIL